MKQFKLKDTKNTADNVIKAIENRAKKQSRFYAIIFAVIVFVVGAIILNNVSVREYNGYISHKTLTVRTSKNVAIIDYFVKEGDIVNEGDTLYSYIVIDWLDEDNYSTSTVIKNDSDLRIAKYNSEIVEINNIVDSLQTTIADTKKKVDSGVKTEDELVGLHWELSQRIERVKHLKRAISAEYDMQSKYNDNITNINPLTQQGFTERKVNTELYGTAFAYRRAYVDSRIIKIKAPYGMLTLTGEEIIELQPIDHPDMTDTHINLIVEADKYKELSDGMEVQVYAGGEFLCDATVSLLGVRMAEAYANIETLLDRTTDLNGKVIVPLKFKDGYELPEIFYIHNYPVEIRYRVWGDLSKWFNWINWVK